MFRIDRKIFKDWVLNPKRTTHLKCLEAEVRLIKGETIILTMNGYDFSKMRFKNMAFREEYLERLKEMIS